MSDKLTGSTGGFLISSIYAGSNPETSFRRSVTKKSTNASLFFQKKKKARVV